MSTLVIKPKTEEEQDLLTRLLEKMNIEVNILEEPVPNYTTRKAMGDVKDKKGTKVKNARELFIKLGI